MKLRQRLAALEAELERLREENARLIAENRLLHEKLEEAERLSARQAAPFRRDESRRSQAPRKPGRKAGHAPVWRERPQEVDELIEVPLDHCPRCGSRLERVRPVEQIIEDLPVMRPHVTRLVTYEGRCPNCGRIRSSHECQVSQARGAAGVQLGRRALGAAMDLVHTHGLTRRKASRVLWDMCGLRVSPGGLVQAAHRLAGQCQSDHGRQMDRLRNSSVVHSDETSWWVNGKMAWLWVFTTPSQTVYHIDRSRGRQVIHDVLGEDFGGVLVSDCLSIYDDATAVQHKCYAHHLKAISKARQEATTAQDIKYCDKLRGLLVGAMALKGQELSLGQDEWQRMRRALDKSARYLLGTGRAPPGSQKIANRLRKQADHLFTFLDHQDVDATNNLAERQLRPAVITRKLSCGNRTDRGAKTWQVLGSLSATCRQQNQSFSTFIAARASKQA